MQGKIYRAAIYNGIDGTLAVDFDPTDWSSGSTWTQAEEPHNLILQSEDFATTWESTGGANTIDPNVGDSPIGTVTADSMSFSGSAYPGRRQPFTSVNGQTYTVSVWVKRISGSGSGRIELAGSGLFSGGDVPFTATTEWQLVTGSRTAIGSGTAYFYIYPEYGASQTGVYHFWGAQLNRGPTALTYLLTTTVGAGRQTAPETWTKNGNAYVGGHTVSNESTVTMDAVPEADDTANTLDIKVTGVAATRLVWTGTATLTPV